MSEYVIEIETFQSVEEARKWATAHLKPGKKQVNIVSRDIDVIELAKGTA